MTCSVVNSLDILWSCPNLERLCGQVEGSTKYTKRTGLCAISCDFVDHSYPTGKKTRNRISVQSALGYQRVIRSHLMVRLSTRDRFTANPIPGLSGALIVPRDVTITGGSTMSSAQ